MSVLGVICFAVAVALAVYLCFALLGPEKFQ